MKHMLRFFSLILAGLFTVSAAKAEVTLPNIFGDHMVLQQKQPNKIWGKANAGETVSISIDGKSVTATAGDDGLWSTMLPAMEVGEPRELVVSGSSKITIKDVLIGEVWICSGQSNMEWRVSSGRSKVNDWDLERATANFPQIRMINYPNTGSQEPIWTHPDSKWMVCSPETVGEFSGVGYFFGRRLLDHLDVPIGLINNAWGGSAADAWVDRETLANTKDYQTSLTNWEKREAQFAALEERAADLSPQEKKSLEALRRQMRGNQRPANIYNGVLSSHLGYGIKGAIWYQGESNAGRAYQYRYLFPLMIQTWRDDWGQGDFPFYWVQLADFQGEVDEPVESTWAELREAQTMTMSKLSNTGEAVIIDAGEGKDIHPRNKQIVGSRLARWALAKQYGLDVAYQSPTYQSMEKSEGKITLSFEHINGGWRPFDVKDPVGFAIAGEDKKFVWADAKIVGDKIEVWSDEVKDPVAVRYAWAQNPVCNMFDDVGLPLTPFRTDDWPGITVNSN